MQKTKRRSPKKPKIIRDKPYVISKETQSAGGKAKAETMRAMRDAQTRRVMARLAKISNLPDLKYRPVLLALARVSVLASRAYKHLKDRDSLLDEKGQLCSSIDTFRRLTSTQLDLFKAVGLTPSALLSADRNDREILAAVQRIENLTDARDDANGSAEQDA
jgi:hypothetical protein